MDATFELAYLGLEIPQPQSLADFLGDVIGLVPVGADATSSRWRNDDKVQRLIIDEGPKNDAVRIGLEYADDARFDAAVERLESAGFDVRVGSDELAADRSVERIATTTAPWGADVELVVGLATADTPFESPLYPGGFHTVGVGFGHVVFATTAFDESVRFVTEGLGMGQSDWIETEIADGIELTVRFFHANPRHHSIALAKAPFDLPTSMHHFMLETNERDDVGAAFDRAYATDLPIPNGLGRHDNDHMFSFYVQSPAGFQVEVGHGARLVTDDWDDDRQYSKISMWGHQPVR